MKGPGAQAGSFEFFHPWSISPGRALNSPTYFRTSAPACSTIPNEKAGFRRLRLSSCSPFPRVREFSISAPARGVMDLHLPRLAPMFASSPMTCSPKCSTSFAAGPRTYVSKIFSAASWDDTQARAPYDRIFALNVLHEIDDETLRSLAPLLAPQGDVLIFDWDATIDRPTGPPAEHAHSPAEARDRIARSGLRCIERIRDARFPYHFILRASRLQPTDTVI